VDDSGGEHSSTISTLLSNGTIRIPPSLFREMWSTPHARKVIEDFAFRRVLPGELNRELICLAGDATIRRECDFAAATLEEDVFIWDTCNALSAEMLSRKLDKVAFGQIFLFFNGTVHCSSRIGAALWRSAIDNISSGSQGQIAYLLGRRSKSRGNFEDARVFLDYALSHAAEKSLLHFLAADALSKLNPASTQPNE
jgi:hypothetical protein